MSVVVAVALVAVLAPSTKSSARAIKRPSRISAVTLSTSVSPVVFDTTSIESMLSSSNEPQTVCFVPVVFVPCVHIRASRFDGPKSVSIVVRSVSSENQTTLLALLSYCLLSRLPSSSFYEAAFLDV
ncbi:MAG: hypothetical protein JW889_08020 [Verrucomicrobia bacterium]|nr:hypothetical protein [Verrucomicrobiota bacterium]